MEHLAAAVEGGLRAQDLRALAACHGGDGMGVHAGWIAARLEAGDSLAEAVASLDATFDAADASVVAAAVDGGRLAAGLRAWASVLRARAELARGLRVAIVLPVVTFLGVLLSATIVAWKVLPTLRVLVVEGGVAMPAATRLLVWAIVDASTIAGVVLAVLVSLGVVAWIVPETLPSAARRLGDRVVLGLPVLGRARVLAARTVALETIASARASGRPLPDALRDAARGQRSTSLRRELELAAAELERGTPITTLPAGRVLDVRTRAALARALPRADAPAALGRLARRDGLALRRVVRGAVAVAPGIGAIAVGVLAGLLAVGTYGLMFALSGGVQ